MKAVIPAAGEGTRLRPLTERKPKALVDVAGRPILSHCFDTLLESGVSEFIVVVGYEGEQIIDAYGGVYRNVPITYVEQSDRLGLGHAVLRAEPHLNDDFVVMNGDNIFSDGVEHLIQRVSDPAVDAAMLVEKTTREAAQTTGVVETEGTRVIDVVEKPETPPSTLVSAGCWVFPPAIFRAIDLVTPSDRGEYELTDAVALLAEAGWRVETVRVEGERVNINTEKDVKHAEELLESA